MYEEFKKYDIQAEEIARLESERSQLIDEFGTGSSGAGGSED